MVLIEAQGPRTAALDILLSFYLDLILVLPYFCFRSLLPEVQGSSGTIGEAVRATQRHQFWRYIAATDNIIGAAWNSALMGEAGKRRRTYRRSAANSQRQYEVFTDFFYDRCASPISGVQIAEQIVLAQHKENERIGKARKTIRSALPIVTEIA